MKRPGLARIALILGVIAFTWVLPTVPAQASTCSTETGIFINKPNRDAYSTDGYLYTYKQGLGSCGGPVVQTQLIIFTSDNLNWVEAGYIREYTGIIGGTKERVFGEWGYYPAKVQVKKYYQNEASGRTARFKVSNRTGTFDWYIYDVLDGSTTWHYLDTYSSLWDTHGTAYGEVSHYGGTDTDAFNHEWGLFYRDSAGTYHSYNGLACGAGNDTISNFQWSKTSNTEFYVVRGSGTC